MAFQDIALQNFAGGELSPKMYGRDLLPIYKNGLRRAQNGIIQTQGAWDYRPGFRHVKHTRLNQVGDLFRFQFNKEQNYQIEATHKKFRFYRNNELILDDTVTVTGITKANPAVVTTGASHGYATGDEVFLDMTGLGGMKEVDSTYFLVIKTGASSFSLTDIDGNPIDSTAFTTFTAGTTARVTEIDTPYREDLDLFALKKAQTKDIMYIDHPFYEPLKLTRTDHNAWTLDRYPRLSDPFILKFTVTGITVASPPVVSATSHPFVEDEIVLLEDITGTMGPFLNGQCYLIKNVIATTSFELFDVVTGAAVDTSGLSFGAGGFSSNQNLLPAAVALFQSRGWHGGQFAFPQKFWASRGPIGPTDPNPGDPRYDDFTLGTDADHAFTNAISDSEVNAILWFAATDEFLLAGTFGSAVKITGSTSGTAVTPTSIKAVALEREGAADIQAIVKKNNIFYVEAGALDVTSLRFEFDRNGQVPQDHNLVSDHITESGIIKTAWQSGRPDVFWTVMNNGLLAGMTVEPSEGIAGWHRHTTGDPADGDKFLTVSTMSRPNNRDQVWVIIERLINGNIRREVAFMEDPAEIPQFIDFFTGDANKAVDEAKFLRAMAEAQKEYMHLDSGLTFDGSARGVEAAATLTPGALTGATVVFTASAGVFLATDDDSQKTEIRKKSIDGVGKGRAIIKAFTNSTTVTCEILEDFDTTTAIAAGDWYITARTLSGLDHLEGRAVGVCGDGAPIENLSVSNGAVTLPRDVSKAHIGLLYIGFLQPMAIEFGGVTGTSVGRNKVVIEIGFRLLNTLGAETGHDLYKSDILELTKMPLGVGNPSPLFSGIQRVPFNDTWESNKIVYVRQRKPLPCTVQTMVIYGEAEES